MHWIKVSLIVLAGPSLAFEQKLLQASSSQHTGKLELLEKLREAEIIPDVLDTFEPLVQIAASWKNGTASLGNTLDPSDLQHAPTIDLIHWTDDNELLKKHKHTQITLALTDPDAPSHDDPKWSQVCHWLVTRLSLDDALETESKKFKEIVEYKPPGPPPKTALHRYVFVALAPLNGTSRKLHLSEPSGRKHWGYDGFRTGIREWAAENGLGAIGKAFCHIQTTLTTTGANFIYAQNAEQ